MQNPHDYTVFFITFNNVFTIQHFGREKTKKVVWMPFLFASLIHKEQCIRTMHPCPEVSLNSCCLSHSELKLRTHLLPPANACVSFCLHAHGHTHHTLTHTQLLQKRNLLPVLLCPLAAAPEGLTGCNTRPAACSLVLPDPESVASSAQMLWQRPKRRTGRPTMVLWEHNHTHFISQEQQTNRSLFRCR